MPWFVGPRGLTTGDTIYFEEDVILDYEQPSPPVDLLILLTCNCSELGDAYTDQQGLDIGEAFFHLTHSVEQSGVTLRGVIATMVPFVEEMDGFQISDITIADPSTDPPPVEFAGLETLEYPMKRQGRETRVVEKAVVLDLRNPGKISIKPKAEDQDRWLFHVQLRRKNGQQRLCHSFPPGMDLTVSLANVLAGFPKGVMDAQVKQAAERSKKVKHPRGVASTDLSVRWIKTDPVTGGVKWAKTIPIYFPL